MGWMQHFLLSFHLRCNVLLLFKSLPVFIGGTYTLSRTQHPCWGVLHHPTERESRFNSMWPRIKLIRYFNRWSWAVTDGIRAGLPLLTVVWQTSVRMLSHNWAHVMPMLKDKLLKKNCTLHPGVMGEESWELHKNEFKMNCWDAIWLMTQGKICAGLAPQWTIH